MAWQVEYTDEFAEWYEALDGPSQDSIDVVVGLLEAQGTTLGHPYSTSINDARTSHLRELRKQHAGHPLRVLYAFDPRRTAILLIGGDKTGDDRWYDRFVPIADRLYADHLVALREEGLL